MRADFDWSQNSECVVFPTVLGVAVYRNADGDVVIRQQAGPLDEDDTFVILPEMHLQHLIKALQVC